MKISGEHRLRAPRDVVWSALLDPRVLRETIPGCERLEPTGPGAYDVALRIGIAAIRGTYRGRVLVTDERPGESYRVTVSGSGSPGSGSGLAQIFLSGDGDATIVRFDGELTAQGGLARLGGRGLAGVVKLLIGQFFRSMDRHVGGGAF